MSPIIPLPPIIPIPPSDNQKSSIINPQFPRVEVLWHDIVVDNDWHTADSELPPSPCITRGWLVRDIPAEPYIVIASGLSLNDSGEWDANPRTSIPRSLVTYISDFGFQIADCRTAGAAARGNDLPNRPIHPRPPRRKSAIRNQKSSIRNRKS